MHETLGLDSAHLWYVRPERAADPELLRSYERLLGPGERSRADGMRRVEARHQYVLTRALVRTVLSRYAGVPPRSWRFVADDAGRPRIAGPGGIPPLQFNLSHTRGFIACLVALDLDVGVDVEDAGRSGRLLDIAERYFAPAETAELRELPVEPRRRRFFEYWTLKESLVKALGLRLPAGLTRFRFRIGEDRIRVEADPPLADADRWRFALLYPTDRHVLATSIRSKGNEVRVEPRETVPLAGW